MVVPIAKIREGGGREGAAKIHGPSFAERVSCTILGTAAKTHAIIRFSSFERGVLSCTSCSHSSAPGCSSSPAKSCCRQSAKYPDAGASLVGHKCSKGGVVDSIYILHNIAPPNETKSLPRGHLLVWYATACMAASVWVNPLPPTPLISPSRAFNLLFDWRYPSKMVMGLTSHWNRPEQMMCEMRMYKKRFREGYDVHDPQFELWV